jgi:protein TonB
MGKVIPNIHPNIKKMSEMNKAVLTEFPLLSELSRGTFQQVHFRARQLLNPTLYKASSKRSVSESSYDDKVFTKVQQSPQFPGGMEMWKKYLERNLNVNAATLGGVSRGTYNVKVQFITDKEGNVSNVQAIETPKECPGCSVEAIKVIKKGPKWQPAVQNGRNVVFQNVVTINFPVKAL